MDERRSERGVFEQPNATTEFECQGWKAVLEIARGRGEEKKKKKDKKLIQRIRGFDLQYLRVEHVFTAAVVGSTRETQLTDRQSANKENKRGRRTFD